MDKMSASRESILAQVKKWRSELNESLARAQKSRENDIVRMLEIHANVLEVLIGSLEGNEGSFPKDFWSQDSTDTKVNQQVDQVIAHISNLKLPVISKRTDKKEASIARRGH